MNNVAFGSGRIWQVLTMATLGYRLTAWGMGVRYSDVIEQVGVHNGYTTQLAPAKMTKPSLRTGLSP